MLDKETYEKEIVRMWDSIRKDEYYKGCDDCTGVECEDCPIYDVESKNCKLYNDIYKVVGKWSDEHQPQKYKVSQLEYDILKSFIDIGFVYYFYESDLLMSLLRIGYFQCATNETDIEKYFKNCEVDCELGGNENVKRRKV